MITEDYVSLKVAKLLKEKGFNEKCIGYYPRGENTEVNHSFLYERNSDWIDNSISAPTHQMAMKWLREVHKILVVVGIKKEDKREYRYSIKSIRNNDIIGISDRRYIHYEEAVEAALKYCLTNLI